LLSTNWGPSRAVERHRLAVPAPLACSQQTDCGDIRRQVEPLRGKRSLQALPSVEGQHAFAGIAVELNVDARKGNGPADYVRLRLEREAAKSAARRSVLARPAQRIAQGNGIGRKRALHLERGAMADVAVEREFKRRPGETEFEAGSLAQQRGGEVGQADAGVDRLVMPREASGGGGGWGG